MQLRRHALVLASLVITRLLCGDAAPAHAGSPLLKDVCASGCTYSNLQTAIDSITDSSATNVYTIFIDAGVLSSDNSFSLNGKDYIHITGRGMGTSIIRASALWFQNAGNGLTSANFLDLSDSHDVTLSGITVDARTQDPGGYGASTIYAGAIVYPPAGTKCVIENSEILGISYGVSGQGTVGTGGGLVDVFNSRIEGAVVAFWPYNVNWHLFATDVRLMDTGPHSGQVSTSINAIAVNGNGETTLWGSHVHAESSQNASWNIAAIGQSLGTINVIGTTVHVKMTVVGTISTRRMTATMLTNGTMNLIGSEILYQSVDSFGAGRLAGIGFSNGGTINVVGTTIRDAGGSGGTTRSDLFSLTGSAFNGLRIVGTKVNSFASFLGGNPTNAAKEFDTLGTQKGTATFGGSGTTIAVTLPVVMPDINYRVAATPDRNEVIWVTGKTTTGFTLNSSKANSVAVVEWVLMR